MLGAFVRKLNRSTQIQEVDILECAQEIASAKNVADGAANVSNCIDGVVPFRPFSEDVVALNKILFARLLEFGIGNNSVTIEVSYALILHGRTTR